MSRRPSGPAPRQTGSARPISRTIRARAGILALALGGGTACCPPVLARVTTTAFSAGALDGTLITGSQTLQSLSPAGNSRFSFLPDDSTVRRDGPGYNHLGDLHLRLRLPGGPWRDYATQDPRGPIAPLPAGGPVLAAADITAELGRDMPVQVIRRWMDVNGTLTLRFVLTNVSGRPVEIGVLGIPMVFGSILDHRSIDQNNALSVFADPYPGHDAGYVQVTHLSGGGPALLVLPEQGTPLDAWEPIRQDKGGTAFADRTPISQTFEGFYDWTVATSGLADTEWRGGGTPWNVPAGITLAPNETRSFGLRFVLSPTIRGIGATLRAAGQPDTIAVPGYVLPTDLDGNLFIGARQPIVSTTVVPAGAVRITPLGTVGGYARFGLRGVTWGRARISLFYADGAVQTLSYFVTRPLDQVNADLGHFITTRQWFAGQGDPFHRSPAILTYDDQAHAIVTQEKRVWIAGMSDEAGAGSYVADAMKQLDNPVPSEVARLDQLVDTTIAHTLQVPSGTERGAVRKSLFFFQPGTVSYPYSPDIDWSTWASWNKANGFDDVGRAYDYPHVTIAYWTLYRLARNHPGLSLRHPWPWYLQHAYLTVAGMMADAPYYTQFGLMEGSVFEALLRDLRSEPGFAPQAARLETMMKARADAWSKQTAPYGSEMAWDSTGQEEVYTWEQFFGYRPQARATRDSILAYDPAVPGWGFNGNARRYWDFLYAGKIPGIERMIYHYGAALNAIPLFDSFRDDPADLPLLRLAYGSFLGSITNIDQKGFGSVAFHSDPRLMRWDPYTGDYGMGYYGHAVTAATYLVKDPALGWLAYGGNLAAGPDAITVEPKDGARTRLYVAPAGMWVELEAGKITAARYTPGSDTVTLILDPATRITPQARLFVSHPTDPSHPYTVRGGTFERNGYTVALGRSATTIQLVPARGG